MDAANLVASSFAVVTYRVESRIDRCTETHRFAPIWQRNGIAAGGVFRARGENNSSVEFTLVAVYRASLLPLQKLPTVTPAQTAKIDAGVTACLKSCQDPTRLYSSVSAFMEGMKADPSWTAQELIELQTRVIRILLQRHHGDDPPRKESDASLP